MAPDVKTRKKMAKPAALDAVETNPVKGVGEPSYTSGVQKWKGTADILKANPATMETMAMSSTATVSGVKVPSIKDNILPITYRFVPGV